MAPRCPPTSQYAWAHLTWPLIAPGPTFSLPTYQEEEEVVVFLNNWVKQVSWVLGLGLLTKRWDFHNHSSVCDASVLNTGMQMGSMIWSETESIKKKCKLWSYLAASHPSFKGSTPSFHQLCQMFLWVISGNSHCSHSHPPPLDFLVLAFH